MTLTSEQTYALLDVIESRKHLSLHIDSSLGEAQGLLLGGDLEKNILCISETHPVTRQLLTGPNKHQHAHIRIKQVERYLVLSVCLVALDPGLSYWKVLNAHWTENKRWQARARFNTFQSPKVILTREFATNINAELHDISQGGFSVSVWNKDLQSEFVSGQVLTPQLIFNEYFVLRTDAIVISSTFLRKPSCHTRTRFRFKNLNEVEQCQLNLLIENMSQRPHAA